MVDLCSVHAFTYLNLFVFLFAIIDFILKHIVRIRIVSSPISLHARFVFISLYRMTLGLRAPTDFNNNWRNAYSGLFLFLFYISFLLSARVCMCVCVCVSHTCCFHSYQRMMDTYNTMMGLNTSIRQRRKKKGKEDVTWLPQYWLSFSTECVKNCALYKWYL